MTAIINGDSPSVTFSDGTTQSTAFKGSALAASPYTTSLGASTLVNNTGTGNTAIGNSALANNTTASNNTAVGYQAMQLNTTGTQNTAVGMQTMISNTTGNYNVAIGGQDSTTYPALYANITGANNVAVGNGALGKNTTGSNNTAVGYQALYTQSGGTNRNTALGQQAGYSATNGQECTFIGYQAGYAVTSGGGDNTFVGGYAGSAVTSGYANTIIGKYTGNQGGLDIRTANNYIVLSDGAGNTPYYATMTVSTIKTTNRKYEFTDSALFPNPDNTIAIGGASNRFTTVYATTALINTSDATQKQQIRSLNDAEKSVAIRIKGLMKAFKFNNAVETKGDEARIHIGVVAQEVQSAFEAEGLDASKYAMFCSDTWYEVDGKALPSNPYTKDTPNAIEVTRLGIRYDQLLAFVISAI